MKIEDLTKQQIVLLCFLVAFVSSTASAIVVVRLMEQAPVTSSPTINRVIERTVQQVVPGETREITRVNTVVVKEEDLVVEAIEENNKSVVLVKEAITNELGVETQIINGTGLYLDGGYIVADGRAISGPGNYYLESGEVKIALNFVSKDKSGLSFLKIDDSINLEEVNFKPKSIQESPEIKVGQSAIVLSGNPGLAAFTGLISSFSPFKILSEAGEQEIFSKVHINIDLAQSHSGSVLVNSDGDVSGVVMVRDGEVYGVPVRYIRENLDSIKGEDVAENLSASAGEAILEG